MQGPGWLQPHIRRSALNRTADQAALAVLLPRRFSPRAGGVCRELTAYGVASHGGHADHRLPAPADRIELPQAMIPSMAHLSLVIRVVEHFPNDLQHRRHTTPATHLQGAPALSTHGV